MVIDWINTSVRGRSDRSVSTASICARTSSPLTTFPTMEYFGGSPTPYGPLTMKNWLPLVSGPALAMATDPIS